MTLLFLQAMLAEINRADWTGGYAASLAQFEQLQMDMWAQQEKEEEEGGGGGGNISSILEIGECVIACSITNSFTCLCLSPFLNLSLLISDAASFATTALLCFPYSLINIEY